MKHLLAAVLVVVVFGTLLADASLRRDRERRDRERRDIRSERSSTRRLDSRRDRMDTRRDRVDIRRDIRRDRMDHSRRLGRHSNFREESELEMLVKSAIPEVPVGGSGLGASLGVNSGRFEL